jgi:hypothetical protein
MCRILINKEKANKEYDSKFIGNLFFFKRHSNIFLVLSNDKMRHIATFTSGSSQLGKNKKKKISPFNMLNLVKNLKASLLKNDIKFLNFFLKQRFSRHFFNLRKMFKLNEIKVNNYIFLLYKAYSSSKKRSIRRI